MLCYYDGNLHSPRDNCLIRHPLQCRCFLFALFAAFATVSMQGQATPAAKTQIVHAGKLIDVRTGKVATDAYTKQGEGRGKNTAEKVGGSAAV